MQQDHQKSKSLLIIFHNYNEAALKPKTNSINNGIYKNDNKYKAEHVLWDSANDIFYSVLKGL